MKIKKNETASKKYYIYTGIAVGFLLSSFYVYWNLTHRTGAGLSATPDPVWTIFVNISLIFFVVIYQSIIIFRVVEWYKSRRDK